ncbi:MAG: hypothetical protein HY320_15515, partial [Armatimonadetes bacterium]|nr:hypothetical protein [Armatimonadota bacterium]
ETAAGYFPRLKAYLQQAGVPPEQATAADLQFLNRAPQFDPLFPAAGLVGTLERFCAGLGIPLESLPNLHLDIEARPLKSPRAFCAPIRVPDEVMLVIMPRGGPDDYRALYHEAGHALHFALTAPDLPLALQLLGDNSVTECYAFLMDNLVQNPAWMREILGVSDGADYRALTGFYKTWMLRRYAAKLLYEIELHADADLDAMPERYARGLSDALGVEVRPVNYLADVDDAYYAARYLRAWMLEVQLREFLQSRLGPLWFQARAAGTFLRDLWRRGESLTEEDLAREMGADGIHAEPLIQELAA